MCPLSSQRLQLLNDQGGIVRYVTWVEQSNKISCSSFEGLPSYLRDKLRARFGRKTDFRISPVDSSLPLERFDCDVIRYHARALIPVLYVSDVNGCQRLLPTCHV